jgi:hypothetical protein
MTTLAFLGGFPVRPTPFPSAHRTLEPDVLAVAVSCTASGWPARASLSCRRCTTVNGTGGISSSSSAPRAARGDPRHDCRGATRREHRGDRAHYPLVYRRRSTGSGSATTRASGRRPSSSRLAWLTLPLFQ